MKENHSKMSLMKDFEKASNESTLLDEQSESLNMCFHLRVFLGVQNGTFCLKSQAHLFLD